MQRTPFDIPDQMREAADKSVDQAKKVFDQVIEATQQAVAKAESSSKSMREGAADLNRQALAYIEDNVAASFDLAKRMAQARTIEEVAALQQEFMRRQLAAASEQSKGLGEMMSRTVGAASGKPKR